LRDAGIPFRILEARPRAGGRIFTEHPRGLAVPVELGAEFTHGEAPEVIEIARRERLRVADISGRRFQPEAGRLRMVDDFWERLDRVMRRLRDDRQPDRTFAEALASNRSIAPRDRALAMQYVEGFHAANPVIISERALAEGGSPRGDVRERRIGRVLDGYGSIVESLSAGIEGRIRLRSVVTAIEWEAGAARVRLAGGGVVRGSAVVVTVPVGVLAAPAGERGAIRFDPALPAIESAVASLAMGGVIRIGLRFDESWWTTARFAARAGDDRLDTMSFLHGRNDVPFAVWWTTYPVRSPLLVAWCGGPKSFTLAGRPKQDIEREALRSLAAMLPVTVARLERHLVSSHLHDWIADPFSRGAYSYARVGGDDASRRLARPVAETIYLAGEAADVEGRTGTVHGAIATGRRVAALIAGRPA
jgi:monoamine oxidase